MTLADIAVRALTHNGYHDGAGYLTPSPWNAYTGGVADCALFACAMARDAGYRLPKWGTEARFNGTGEGFQYVPTGWVNARKVPGATVSSWQAPVGAFALFNWLGDAQPIGNNSHIEVVTGYVNGVLYTVGQDSGPSNVDGFKGRGGVHRHAWSAPVGVGNPLIQGIVLPDRIAAAYAPPAPVTPPAPRPAATGPLDVPTIDAGHDAGHPSMVALVQACARIINPTAGTLSGDPLDAAIEYFQRIRGLEVDRRVGPATMRALVERAANGK